jgi:protein arginine kinase
VEGYAFTGRAREGERLRVLTQVHEAVGQVAGLRQAVLYRMDDLSPLERGLLHERHLVSKELAGLEPHHGARVGAGVILADGLGVMVNEEDHLRLQSLRSGFQVEEAFAGAERLDRELGALVPYSYHPEFGFLTACPTNVGTGLRASVLIHLPGLVLTKEIGRVLTSLQQMGLTYRGLYGEGSEVVGNFFQISNQQTLGRSEEELVELLLRVVGYIIEDKLWRAYGTVRYARSLTFDEAMKYLSGVRLAVGLKLIAGLSVYTLNKLLIHSQAAHLASQDGRALTESETNLARARYVRTALGEEAGSVG